MLTGGGGEQDVFGFTPKSLQQEVFFKEVCLGPLKPYQSVETDTCANPLLEMQTARTALTSPSCCFE